jgi:rhodanese-related sulfurtransferase
MMSKILRYAALAVILASPLANAAETDRTGAAAAADPHYTYAPDPRYTYKTPRLNRAELDALFAKPESLLVLDIRRPDELASVGGFPAYLSIQVSDLEKNLAYLPKDRTIVIVSNRAHRAGAAGDLLTGHGFKVAGAIGVLDYKDQGGTINLIEKPTSQAAAAAPAATAPEKH